MNCIKIYRKEKGYTLKQLSLLTNLSVGYLSHLENGTRKNPSLETIKKISTALNKPIEKIL